MYIKRLLSPVLKECIKQFPAILITGPRQSGKTTFLLHELGKNFKYISFDDPLERNFALSDPKGFLDRFSNEPVILDEIQYAPEILPYLKIRIDKERMKTGRWILTGSQQFQLMKNVSESLAGRVAVLDLYPFSLLEARTQKDRLESIIWNGSYPEPSLYPKKRDIWIRSYIQTYIERDVRQLQNIKDMRLFEVFLGLCAAHHSQMLNTASLSRECGVSLPTIKTWSSVLEASYICCLLPPYYKNYGKRLIKTPKLYFIDSAIVCELTRQPDGKSAKAGAMGGAIFEGLMISEAVKVFALKGKKANIFYWRSHDGLEVDLIIQIGAKLYPVEIKLTATPTLKHLEPINKFKTLAGKDAAETGLIVCSVKEKTILPSNNIAIPWHQFPKWLKSLIDGNK
jgi:predicted AAA+ superfamily ATPase